MLIRKEGDSLVLNPRPQAQAAGSARVLDPDGRRSARGGRPTAPAAGSPVTTLAPDERQSALPCMLDTHALSELIRNPHGTLAGKLNALATDAVCTSIVAACELRFGAQRKGSAQLTQRVEQLLQALLPPPPGGGGAGGEGVEGQGLGFPPLPNPSPARGEGLKAVRFGCGSWAGDSSNPFRCLTPLAASRAAARSPGFLRTPPPPPPAPCPRAPAPRRAARSRSRSRSSAPDRRWRRRSAGPGA